MPNFATVDVENERSVTLGTAKRGVFGREQNGVSPVLDRMQEMLFSGLCAISFLDEIQRRDGFSKCFIVFVSDVMKYYIFAVIIINTRCCNNRSAEISVMYLMVISGVSRFGFART